MLNYTIDTYRRLPFGERFRARLRYQVLRTLPWLFPRILRPGSSATEIEPGVPLPGKVDYLFFGMIDWHLRFQRPQQLATRLARAGHRVLYVTSNLIPTAAPGFRVEPLPDSGRLFQIHLQAAGSPAIYYGTPPARTARQLKIGLRMLLDWASCDKPVAAVQHPFWVDVAQSYSPDMLVYDRMDYHAGFGSWSPALESAEEQLVRDASTTLSSSAWLDQRTARLTDAHALLRNGCDYGHFSTAPAKTFHDTEYTHVIGYYGAIAPWVDLDLIARAALRFDDCLVLLIGHDQAGAAKRLQGLKNVRLIGEIAYDRLPFFLYGFDVCLLPFRRIELTLATNPVKVYEYLCSGLPVVGTDLPEMAQFEDLVYVSRDADEWLAAIADALRESPDDPIRRRRRQYASTQTWDARARRLISIVEGLRSGPGRGG